MLLLLLLLQHLDWVEQEKGYSLIIAIPSVMLTVAAGIITAGASATTIRVIAIAAATVITIITTTIAKMKKDAS